LLKGAVPGGLFWWGWFRKDQRTPKSRELLLSGLFAGLLALVVARGLAETLPFRERPLQNPAVHFQLPYEGVQTTLIGWSSFPSDHAAVFFALATTFCFISRTAGILALCHAFFIVCLPRIYLGYHYPTDILAGAIVGIGAAYLSQRLALRTAAPRRSLEWIDRQPSISYALLFLVTFQIAISFDSVRQLAHFVFAVWRAGSAAPH
jgi:undecaprenyl-diphosphatase